MLGATRCNMYIRSPETEFHAKLWHELKCVIYIDKRESQLPTWTTMPKGFGDGRLKLTTQAASQRAKGYGKTCDAELSVSINSKKPI